MPEHAELFLLLSMVVPIPWLERVPTYKEQREQLSEKDLSTIGFLGYPLLQTADVVIYDAQYVPVGEDQVPHLELSREVVRRFNNFYGEVFVEPQPLLTHVRAPARPRQPEDEQELRQRHRPVGRCRDGAQEGDAACTPTRNGSGPTSRAPSKATRCSSTTTRSTANLEEVEDLKSRYRQGKVGDVEVKKKLAAALNARARADARAPRRGAREAGPHPRDPVRRVGPRPRIARETMERVREAVKVSYR